MNSRLAIFTVIPVLLVPFLYFTSSVPDVCAAPPSVKWGLSQDCTGALDKGDGIKTCCWKEKDAKGNEVDKCQSCTYYDGALYCDEVAFPESLRPGLSGTLDRGEVIEGNTTGPNLTEDRLPAGGVFKVPDTNLTFSQTDSSNMSNNTLAQLQSDVENDTAEKGTGETGEEDEADESEDNEEDE